MRIHVNGEEINSDSQSILDLIETYSLKPQGVAVEYNGEVISRETYDSIQIKDGDKIEILRFVGGG
jgi:sulfur carrier protein